MPKIVDHDLQRRALSLTVAGTLAELGLENTTLRTVAARHGCTKGMVQHYFADKEELLLAALIYTEEGCERRLEGAGGNQTGLALLHTRLAAELPTIPGIVEQWKVRFSFYSRTLLSSEMQTELSRRDAVHQNIALRCLRQAQKAGELKPGLNLRNSYRSLLALVSGISLLVISGGEQLSSAAQRQILKTAIENLRP